MGFGECGNYPACEWAGNDICAEEFFHLGAEFDEFGGGETVDKCGGSEEGVLKG